MESVGGSKEVGSGELKRQGDWDARVRLEAERREEDRHSEGGGRERGRDRAGESEMWRRKWERVR